jgi:hypothetical protein
MKSKFNLPVVLLAVLGSAGAVAREPAPITKREARDLPARQVERRVMAQLSHILTEERWDRRKPPARPLTDMDFVTQPRATSVPNLCQVDRLRVSFRPTRSEKGDADTPVRADGFTADHYFHFREAPKAYHGDAADYQRARNPSECADVDFGKDDFFNAPDEETATDGYYVAQRAIEEILKGKADLPVECDKYWYEKESSCADIVGKLKETSIDSIDKCDAEEAALARCYEIYIGDRLARIVASPIAFGQNVLPPLTPLKVKLSTLIILSHERVD